MLQMKLSMVTAVVELLYLRNLYHKSHTCHYPSIPVDLESEVPSLDLMNEELESGKQMLGCLSSLKQGIRMKSERMTDREENISQGLPRRVTDRHIQQKVTLGADSESAGKSVSLRSTRILSPDRRTHASR